MACVCSLWLVGRGQSRTRGIYIRFTWQGSDSSLIVNSRHTVSVLLVCVNFLAKELQWGSSVVFSVLDCHLLRASRLLPLGQTLLCRQPWQDPAQTWCQEPQRGALPWKKWHWAVASLWLSGSKSLISMGARICLAKEENAKQSLEESPTPFLCPCPEWYIVSLQRVVKGRNQTQMWRQVSSCFHFPL